ncbi:MAG TPA: GMC family oxidoreductase [Burkholderiaceae bacterium]|nr:GMC family oxidoreductase [Burkholderiaceae bacterium]
MTTNLKSREVVFVGGGLTAGLASRQLVAQGRDVLVLERGRDHRGGPEETIPNQRDGLRWGVRTHLAQDWAEETYTFRHTTRATALPARSLQAFLPGNGLGGAANHWNGQTWRWSEYDPILRTHLQNRYGKGALPADLSVQDWGVTYAELEPYHALFEKLFGIAGKAGNINGRLVAGGNPFEAPRKEDYPQPPLELTEAGLVFNEAAARLGYKPFSMPAANSPRPYTNPDGMSLGQCQYCGHCERFICEAKAKASPEVLLYPMLLRKSNFELRLQCHVTHIEYDRAARRAVAVHYVDRVSGQTYRQPAEVIVLSAFTMTNTRLLLLSKIGAAYDPERRRGVVGRNFCHQTNSNVFVFMKDRWINPFLASGSSQTVIDEFNNDNFDHSGLGFFGGGYISGYISNGRPLETRFLPPGTPQWGTAWKRANADWYAHAFPLLVHGSCYSHPDNYLSLDPTYTDRFGQPLLRVTFDFRENELRMSKYVTQRAHEIAVATGGVVAPAVPRKGPYDVRVYQTTHVVGGTAMGADPGTSVVSPHLQHWDAKNLFVVGASTYPQNSGYNPTGPLAALALRLGDDLNRYLARPRVL